MMFSPSRDGFLTDLQETGRASVWITGTDDIGIAADAVREHAWTLGVKVRIFDTHSGVWLVEIRTDAPST